MRRLVDDKGELDDGELDRALWNPVVAGGTDADRAPMSIALIVVRRRRNDPVDQAVRRRRAKPLHLRLQSNPGPHPPPPGRCGSRREPAFDRHDRWYVRTQTKSANASEGLEDE